MAVIFQTFSPGMADIRACVVEQRAMADILVYSVGHRGAALNDTLWYITKNPGIATSKLYFGSRGSAQLLVYFVANRGNAGWQRPHPLRGRL